jgi:integrase/recombinase XerD
MWKKNTLRNYEFVLDNFQKHFGNKDLSSITFEDIFGFHVQISEGAKQNTQKLRFTLLSAFFNFVKNSLDPNFHNPCDNPILRKFFRAGKAVQLKILEKDVVDEIIFRTLNLRNRWCLNSWSNLYANRRGLKLTPLDIDDRKAINREPKSGKEAEVVFLPQKVADRLRKYIHEKGNWLYGQDIPDNLCGCELGGKKCWDMLGLNIRSHDLRSHAATYASRSGTPIEIVSKSYYVIRIFRRLSGIYGK